MAGAETEAASVEEPYRVVLRLIIANIIIIFIKGLLNVASMLNDAIVLS